MLENVQLWMTGTAALFSTVLLFALIERHNWRAVSVWMVILALGAWSWHVGYFVRLLVNESIGPLADTVRWLTMLAMAFGLMTMPSAALHGTCRLLRQGEFRIGVRADPRLLLCYLPLALLLPIGRALAVNPAESFLDLLVNYRASYVCWLSLVCCVAAYGLWRTAQTTGHIHAKRFYLLLAVTMLLIAGLTTTFVYLLTYHPSATTGLTTMVGLLPLIPAVLFAFFVMRFQLLPLILERTLVYGAVVMGVMLFHQVVLREAVSPVEDLYRLNFGVIEGAIALAVILLYPPLRTRVAAALQSLMDSSAVRRTERQRLAVQLAARSGDSAADLLDWFTAVMQRSFGSKLGAAWLSDREGRVITQSGDSGLLGDRQVQQLHAAMAQAEDQFVTRYSATDPQLVEFLDSVRAGALLRFEHADISGLFLIGCRQWGQPPAEEDLSALSLLVEQFGITLHNSQLLALQVAAEHRVLQQEKLSTLGLIAGSLAHEIKNPLSSIKTITRVLAEDLGPGSPYAEDLRMITGEIERLATSTSELLAAARPPRNDQPAASLAELLAPTLRLLQYLAGERQATLDVAIPEQIIVSSCDQVALREIIFNLISNAVEAAGAGGRVEFITRRESDKLIIEVRDTGPGLSADQQSRMFEPFFTTKSTGTGLGLYIVARRARELGGEIDCRSIPGQGTTFLLKLPCR